MTNYCNKVITRGPRAQNQVSALASQVEKAVEEVSRHRNISLEAVRQKQDLQVAAVRLEEEMRRQEQSLQAVLHTLHATQAICVCVMKVVSL